MNWLSKKIMNKELLENNQLKGYGLDFYKKEVTFVSSEKIINE